MSDLRRIIWIASFPKSGNTWVRAVLANYFRPPGIEPSINDIGRFMLSDTRQEFFDQAAGRPFHGRSVEDWLAIRGKAVELIAAAEPGHHFVKTHCQPGQIAGVDLIPPAVSAAAIYILRNPFDVAPSYARHMNMSVDRIIDRMANNLATHATERGIMEVIGRWDTHVHNWTTETRGLPKHVMRYEDMLADAEGAFRALFAFLKLPAERDRLRRVVEAASFDTLRAQEADKGFDERPPHMKSFFSSGRLGAWRDELRPAQVARIREAFLPALEKWYPEMLAETAAFPGGVTA